MSLRYNGRRYVLTCNECNKEFDGYHWNSNVIRLQAKERGWQTRFRFLEYDICDHCLKKNPELANRSKKDCSDRIERKLKDLEDVNASIRGSED